VTKLLTFAAWKSFQRPCKN